MDFADILTRSTLRNSDPIALEGCRVPVVVVLKPLASSEDELIAAAMRREVLDPPPEFDRAKATAEDSRRWTAFTARQVARYQVASLAINGADRTADAEPFLLAWSAANAIAMSSLYSKASDPATFGGEEPVPVEEIAGNSPGA